MNHQLTQDIATLRSLLASPSAWCQHMSERDNMDGSTSYCLVGAITSITRTTNPCSPEMKRRLDLFHHFNTLLCNGDKTSRDCIMHWNDSPHRDHADILNLLDQPATLREVPT